MLLSRINELKYLQRKSSCVVLLNYLADHKNVEGEWHMESNLVFQAVVWYCNQEKVTSGVSIFDKCEEIIQDLRGIVALLEAERKCLLGPSCHPEYSRGSLLHLHDPLLCGCGTASCGREDLCLICTLSPHKEGGFFWGIPDALITLLKTLNWEDRALPKHFSLVLLSSPSSIKGKTNTIGLFRDFSIAPFFYSISLSCVNRNFSC